MTSLQTTKRINIRGAVRVIIHTPPPPTFVHKKTKFGRCSILRSNAVVGSMELLSNMEIEFNAPAGTLINLNIRPYGNLLNVSYMRP